MSETAPDPTARAPNKKSAIKAKTAGPSVGDLIVKAMSASKEWSGVSLAPRRAEESSHRRRLRRREGELPRQARHQEPGD